MEFMELPILWKGRLNSNNKLVYTPYIVSIKDLNKMKEQISYYKNFLQLEYLDWMK